MNYIVSNQLHRVALYVLVSIYVVYIGVVIEPDTISYVGFALITPPGYGTFLFVFRKLLGDGNYFPFIVCIQLVLGFVSCLYLVRMLRKAFNVQKGLLILLDVILLAPIFVPEYLTVNRVVTQGLAYPCFLFIVAFLIHYLFLNHKRAIGWLLFTVFVGMLIRTQFFFVIPVLLLVFGYQWYCRKNRKIQVISVILVLMIPILVSLLQKTFNYLVHDKYVNISSTGAQVIIMPFYVSDAEDYKLYKDPKTQAYFKLMYKTATERELLDDFYKPLNDNVFHHFDYNFAHISYSLFSEEGRKFLNPDNPNSLDALIANDKFLMNMWLPLLFDNFWKCLDLFYKNLEHAFGGFYMIWLCVLLLFGSLYYWMKYKEKLAMLSFIFMILIFSNIVLICIVQHSIGRYMMYHQWMLPVLFILLLNEMNKRMKSNSDSKIS